MVCACKWSHTCETPYLCVKEACFFKTVGTSKLKFRSSPSCGKASMKLPVVIKCPGLYVRLALHWKRTRVVLFSAIVCPWLNVGLSHLCPQVMWCHWGEIEPFSATPAQDGYAVWSVREKPLETLCHCQELNHGHRENRQWDTFILPHELSWLTHAWFPLV